MHTWVLLDVNLHSQKAQGAQIRLSNPSGGPLSNRFPIRTHCPSFPIPPARFAFICGQTNHRTYKPIITIQPVTCTRPRQKPANSKVTLESDDAKCHHHQLEPPSIAAPNPFSSRQKQFIQGSHFIFSICIRPEPPPHQHPRPFAARPAKM